LVGLGKEDVLGSLLVDSFVVSNFMGAIFEGLVVDISAFYVAKAVKDSLYMVACVGF
jgi:hypothetical protein